MRSCRMKNYVVVRESDLNIVYLYAEEYVKTIAGAYGQVITLEVPEELDPETVKCIATQDETGTKTVYSLEVDTAKAKDKAKKLKIENANSKFIETLAQIKKDSEAINDTGELLDGIIDFVTYEQMILTPDDYVAANMGFNTTAQVTTYANNELAKIRAWLVNRAKKIAVARKAKADALK
jgi:hypothetical protein